MQRKTQICSMSFIFLFLLVSAGCVTTQPTPTSTPKPTKTDVPTKTPKPTATPRPTQTPILAQTQQIEEWNADTQKYFEANYLTTNKGRLTILKKNGHNWAGTGAGPLRATTLVITFI
jgi:hypothetical protein